MERFPNHPKLSGIVVFHAMCSYGLNNFEDAAEFLKESLIAPPKPYTVNDVEMLLARCYDKASEEDADEEGDNLFQSEQNDINMAKLAKEQYADAFENAKGTGTTEPGDSTLGDWLNNPNTWRKLAQKCTTAGHFLYAVDCYQQGETSAKAKSERRDEGTPF